MAIVVVLILLATIFVVRFLVLKAPTDYRRGFISSELASSMLSTFLRTSAQKCSQLTMTELLQDCAQAKNIICENGENSCQHAESTAKFIFEKTLDKWSMKYEFLAYTDAKNPSVKIGNACRAEKKSKLFPIPVSTATMYVKLDICG